MEPVNTYYKKWLEEIKCKIKTAQLKVAVSANAQRIKLYWQLTYPGKYKQAIKDRLERGNNRSVVN